MPIASRQFTAAAWLAATILLTSLTLLGCGDSESSVRPYTVDEAFETNRAFVLVIDWQEADGYTTGMEHTNLHFSSYRYDDGFIDAPLESLALDGVPVQLSRNNTRGFHQFLYRIPDSTHLLVEAHFSSGRTITHDLAVPARVIYTPVVDTIYASDSLTVDVQHLGLLHSVRLQARFRTPDREFTDLAEMTSPQSTTFELADNLSEGWITLLGDSHLSFDIFEEMVDDTAHVISLYSNQQIQMKVLPAE